MNQRDKLVINEIRNVLSDHQWHSQISIEKILEGSGTTLFYISKIFTLAESDYGELVLVDNSTPIYSPRELNKINVSLIALLTA